AVIARLTPGGFSAESEMLGIARQLDRQNSTPIKNRGIRILSLAESYRPSYLSTLLMIQGAASFVLLLPAPTLRISSSWAWLRGVRSSPSAQPSAPRTINTSRKENLIAYSRILRPGLGLPTAPSCPSSLRRTFDKLEQEVNAWVNHAKLAA